MNIANKLSILEAQSTDRNSVLKPTNKLDDID
jgi:hypothetical protein